VKGATFKRCPCDRPVDANGRRSPCRINHGSWYFQHELPPKPDGTRSQHRVGGFGTQREAREAMHGSLAAFARGERVVPSRLTVQAYLEQWLEGKSGLRSSTRRSYSEHLDLYLVPALGFLKLSDLTDTDIERMYGAMRRLGSSADAPSDLVLSRLLAARRGSTPRPLSAARLRRVHATLQSALNSAVRRKLLGVNPARHVELAAGRRPRAEVWTEQRVESWRRTGRRPAVAVWTAEQTGQFLDTAAPERLYPLFHLIAYRGLRRGEAVGLRWLDVDLEHRSLRVTQQVVQLGWATEIGAPKTDSGERTISLDAATVAVLGNWRNRQVLHRTAWGADWVDSGLVFTRANGAALHPDLATDAFARILRTAGLPPIRLHDLRHTAASLALQAGVPMKVVSEQLGHSSLAITADTYTSVLPAVARAAAEAVAGVIPRGTRKGGVLHQPRVPGPIRAQSPLQRGSTHGTEDNPGRITAGQRGGPRGDRTHNPRIKSPLLCQLS